MLKRKEMFWNYSEHISGINGDMLSDPSSNITNLVNFDQRHGHHTRNRLLSDVSEKSTLDLYQRCFIDLGKQPYLNNINDFGLEI